MKKILFLLVACLLATMCVVSESQDGSKVTTSNMNGVISVKFTQDGHDMYLYYMRCKENMLIVHSLECEKCKSKNIKDSNSIYDIYGN